MTKCFIGLGANLGDMQHTIEQAGAQLAAHPAIDHFTLSSLYQSKPMGPQNQPDYLNAVAALSTELGPEALLDILQDIEQQSGRVRTQHWGPRTLDLDLLLYGEHQVNTERLTVPHPGLKEREFVLVPLAELAPDLRFTDGCHINELLTAVDTGTLIRL